MSSSPAEPVFEGGPIQAFSAPAAPILGERRLPLFFAAVYLSQGLVGIAYEPIAYLLKDVLRLSPAESAAFTAVMTAPFLLKPLLGALSDAFPLLRRRRLPYMLAASSAAVLGWT